jgi:esterase/lipase superfamily enzyme
MNIEYHKWFSPSLSQDMELKIYGSAGKCVIVFPTLGGRFFEFEEQKMVEACQYYIDNDKIQLYTVDNLDKQSWANPDIPPDERALRHEDFDRYIIREVAPFVRDHNPTASREKKFLSAGCGMGGYHASNFFFRHPDVFDSLICLSGEQALHKYVGEYMDIHVYLNSPLDYLSRLDDDYYLEQYRKSKIIVAVGRGPGDETALADAQALQRLLFHKNIPALIDYWGEDVTPDWIWWRKQFPYFLDKLGL